MLKSRKSLILSIVSIVLTAAVTVASVVVPRTQETAAPPSVIKKPTPLLGTSSSNPTTVPSQIKSKPIVFLGPNDLYWNPNGLSSTWTAANWATVIGGSYTSAWTANKDANFTASSNTTFVTNTQIGNVTVTNGSTVAVTAAGTLSTNGSLRTLDIGGGSILDLAGQNISTVAGTGFVKNGDGILFTANGQAYPGGFTLNAGTVIAGGVNAMGGGPLAINGGTIAANATRSFAAGKFSSVNIGGDFTLGAVTTGVPTGNGSATANITLADNMGLGTATRIITIGSNGIYTLNGVLSSATASTGLTVNAAAGATGTLVLGGANTFTGPVKLSGGTLSVATINNGGVAGNLGKATSAAANLVFDGGTLRYAGASSISTDRNFSISPGKMAIIDVTPNDITFSGGAAATSGGLIKTGPGFLSLSGTNLYSGETVIKAGALGLVGSGSIANSPVIEIQGGTAFDVSTLLTGLTLAPGQGIRATGTSSTGLLATVINRGLTAASNSPLQFTVADSAHVPLTMQGSGTVALSSGNPVTVITTTPLGAGDYTLIAKSATGTVAGSAPTSLTVTGSGLASGTTGSLLLLGGQLVLRVETVPVSHVNISGRVTAANGRGITNAVVTITGGSLAAPLTAVTGRSGFYIFTDLPTNLSYTVTVAARRFTFNPASQVFTPTANITNADFTAQQ